MNEQTVFQVDENVKAKAYQQIVEDLHYRYGGALARDEIAQAVAEARVGMAATSKVQTYLPVLTARFAREILEARAIADGRQVKQRLEVLFVCVKNAGRSQIAAALAGHLSNNRVNVRSAGSSPAGKIDPLVAAVLEERGVPLVEAYPKPLSDSVVRASDVIVTMGCGDSCPYYPGKRYLDWNVADPVEASRLQVRAIVDDIQVRITALLHELLDKE